MANVVIPPTTMSAETLAGKLLRTKSPKDNVSPGKAESRKSRKPVKSKAFNGFPERVCV